MEKLSKKESAKLAGQASFIYLLREIKTNKIIYVGCTRYVGRRLTEHKSSLLDEKNRAAIYMYMRENNLKFFVDVEFNIVDYIQDREQAQIIESQLIDKYKATALNTIKYDTRKYNTDPRFKKVRCVTTGEEFWAVQPVLEKYNVSRYLLDKAITNQEPIHSGEVFQSIE